MKKTDIIVIISVIAIVLVCMIVAFPYALFVVKNQNYLHRVTEQMKEEAFEYLEKEVTGFSRNDWKFAKGVMNGKDKEIEKQNVQKSSEEFVYPYSNVELTFEKKPGSSDSRNIVVRFEKNENGELEIVGYRYEKQD